MTMNSIPHYTVTCSYGLFMVEKSPDHPAFLLSDTGDIIEVSKSDRVAAFRTQPDSEAQETLLNYCQNLPDRGPAIFLTVEYVLTDDRTGPNDVAHLCFVPSIEGWETLAHMGAVATPTWSDFTLEDSGGGNNYGVVHRGEVVGPHMGGDMFPSTEGHDSFEGIEDAFEVPSHFRLLETRNSAALFRQVSTGVEKWIENGDLPMGGDLDEVFYDADPTWVPEPEAGVSLLDVPVRRFPMLEISSAPTITAADLSLDSVYSQSLRAVQDAEDARIFQVFDDLACEGFETIEREEKHTGIDFDALYNLYSSGTLPLATIFELLDLARKEIPSSEYTLTDATFNKTMQQLYSEIGQDLVGDSDTCGIIAAHLEKEAQALADDIGEAVSSMDLSDFSAAFKAIDDQTMTVDTVIISQEALDDIVAFSKQWEEAESIEAKFASGDLDTSDLAKLWESAPDVSATFGTTPTYERSRATSSPHDEMERVHQSLHEYGESYETCEVAFVDGAVSSSFRIGNRSGKTNMTMAFMRGVFQTFVAAHRLELGIVGTMGLDRPDCLVEGEKVEFDGHTLRFSDGIKVKNPEFKGAVKLGWVTPVVELLLENSGGSTMNHPHEGTVLEPGDAILISEAVDASTNGIYIVQMSDVGSPELSSDFLELPEPEYTMSSWDDIMGLKYERVEARGAHALIRQKSTGAEKWLLIDPLEPSNLAEIFYDADPTFIPDISQ